MTLSLAEACNILHIDAGTNDGLVNALIAAADDYITVSTGLSSDKFTSEPLVKTVAGFIITLWYYADKADDIALNRTINNLLTAITLRAREYE